MKRSQAHPVAPQWVRPILLVFLMLGTLTASAQGGPQHYWSDTWRGWHFYEEPEPDAGDKPVAQPKAVSPATPVPTQVQPPKAPELAAFERLQKAVEETRNIAIMQPTEANVRRYMTLESQVVERASFFADMAQRVAWATPELDPTLQGRPVGTKALEVFETQQLAQRSRATAELGRDHVLFFFYRSDCPYCHAFAPTLQAFQAHHGIKVVAIGIDGGPMPGFPDARADNGIATTLRVSQVPALFLAQPFSGRITPVGFGVLSEAQLLERIALISTPQAEAMLPGAARQIGRLSVSP